MIDLTNEDKRKAYNEICKNLASSFDSYSDKLKDVSNALQRLDVEKAYGVLIFLINELSILSPVFVNIIRNDADLDLLNDIILPDTLEDVE